MGEPHSTTLFLSFAISGPSSYAVSFPGASPPPDIALPFRIDLAFLLGSLEAPLRILSPDSIVFLVARMTEKVGSSSN